MSGERVIHDENSEDEDDERVQTVVNYETRCGEEMSRKIFTETLQNSAA